MRFSDEELSRILSAHAVGFLRRSGTNWVHDDVGEGAAGGCIFQVAYNEAHVSPLRWDYPGPGRMISLWHVNVMNWFDAKYNPRWSVARFVRELRVRGLM